LASQWLLSKISETVNQRQRATTKTKGVRTIFVRNKQF
jgi:hypothetical protein